MAKLIDLLVQELPSLGGWPEGAGFIAADRDGRVDSYQYQPVLDESMKSWVDRKGDGYLTQCVVPDECVCDWQSAISQEQYEAALAASQQPAWDGEGLPPVGTECECKVTVNWFRCKVMYISEKCAVLKYGESEQAWFTPSCEFRPIRTEAERKREEFIDQLMKEWLFLGHDREQAGSLYDAIAAGKIPGVKLED